MSNWAIPSLSSFSEDRRANDGRGKERKRRGRRAGSKKEERGRNINDLYVERASSSSFSSSFSFSFSVFSPRSLHLLDIASSAVSVPGIMYPFLRPPPSQKWNIRLSEPGPWQKPFFIPMFGDVFFTPKNSRKKKLLASTTTNLHSSAEKT